MSYVYQSPATLIERQPTGRVDYNLSHAASPERIGVVASGRSAIPTT